MVDTTLYRKQNIEQHQLLLKIWVIIIENCQKNPPIFNLMY